MKLKINFFLAFISLLILLNACKPAEGTGGKARIKGVVMHHEDIIPFASVYIHYGSLDMPGNTSDRYQDSTKADGNGSFVFQNLYKGKYYLYSTGFDANWSPPSVVFGGIPVQIYQRKEEVNVILPVSE